MLESIIRFSLKQRVIILFGAAALVVAGGASYLNLPIEAFPDVLNEIVQVITLAPGQSAQDIERKITIPLEREFTGIPKVLQMRSISEFGLSVVYLYFDDGADKFWARSQTMEKIATAALPAGVQPSLAPMSAATGEILRYEVTGNGYSTTELRTIEDWVLEKQFRSVPGVADVVGFGGKVRTWEVQADPLKLATYGITVRQLADTISNSNSNTGGNMIHWPNQSFVVRSNGEYSTMEDLGHVGVSQRGSAIIRVRDLATVRESNAPVRGIVGRDDKDDIVQGIVLLRKGENPVQVGRSLREKLAELRRGTLLPEGLRVIPYYDRLDLVARTTETVGRNLLEGFLLVCLVSYVFLRNKHATFVVALIVPLSLLFAFILMILTKTPANLVSLGAIDFGIIVDGAVIIVEYVIRRQAVFSLAGKEAAIEEAAPTAPAIEKTISEVLRPVFFSMGIVILAYLPIFTLQRVEGKMFSPLAYTVSFALIGALLLSLTLVPALLPSVVQATKAVHHADPPWLAHMRERYLAFLDVCLESRRKFFACAVGMLVLGAVCLRASGSEFLPELDEGALWIRATFPHSTSLEEGVKLAREIRAMLKAMPEVRTAVSQLGGPEDGTDPNLFDNCEFFVDLLPKTRWKRFGGERENLIRRVRGDLERFPGIQFNVSQPIADNVEEAIAGVKGKNVAKIYGPDLRTLNKISEEVMAAIKSVPGTADVSPIAFMPEVPQLTVRLDRAKVAQAGLSLQDVNDLVETAVGGKTATQVYDGEVRIDVVVRAPERFRQSLEDIRALPISLPGGAKIPLEQLARVEMLDAPQAINREAGYRRIGVKFNVEGRDLGSVMKDILRQAGGIPVPNGYFIQWGGEYENQTRAMRRLFFIVPGTLLLLGIVLFLLFEDMWIVCSVMATLLLAIVGSVVLLYLRGIPFSVSAAVGLLALFGVVGLDDITLASTYVRNRAEHPKVPFLNQIRAACAERFRPLTMTSTLAALGMLPAAISHGIGSETQRPIATAIIGGLATGLPAVLFFLPSALALKARESSFRQSLRRLLRDALGGLRAVPGGEDKV